MAKKRGKKSKKEETNVVRPNNNIKKMKRKVKRRKASKPDPAAAAPRADASEATTSKPANNKNREPSTGKKEQGAQKRLSGFIFMCNPTTKLECFRYRVFGLPMGQKEVVEEIKPGAKLFLYDFELKLLYGIYVATSSGQLNLEPGAFGGKYPAQVKFKIFKECLPLSESVLKQVIKENYTGSKFKQELHAEQVKKLLSSFRPLAAPSSQVYRAPQNVSQSWPMPPPSRENQFNQTLRFLPTEARYVQAAPAVPASVQSAHEVRYVHEGPAGSASIQSAHEARYVHAPLGRAPVQSAQDVRYAHAPLGRAPVLSAQDVRYVHAALEGPAPVQSAQDVRYAHAPLGRKPGQSAQDVRYVHAALEGPAPVQSTRILRQHYDRPASDVAQVNITLGHQSLPATGRYYVPDSQGRYFTESSAREVPQPYPRTREERAQSDQVVTLGRQYPILPSQRESLYRDNAGGYNSYRHASATKYTSNVPVAEAPYAPPPLQPQHQASVPVTPLGLLAHYSHVRATR